MDNSYNNNHLSLLIVIINIKGGRIMDELNILRNGDLENLRLASRLLTGLLWFSGIWI